MQRYVASAAAASYPSTFSLRLDLLTFPLSDDLASGSVMTRREHGVSWDLADPEPDAKRDLTKSLLRKLRTPNAL